MPIYRGKGVKMKPCEKCGRRFQFYGRMRYCEDCITAMRINNIKKRYGIKK